MEFRLPVIIGRAQEAIHGGADVTGFLLGEAALPVAIGDAHPLRVPALEVAGDHAGRGLECFADAAAAFLRLAETAAELVGEPGMIGPMMPSERLVMGTALSGDPLYGVVVSIGCHCA